MVNNGPRTSISETKDCTLLNSLVLRQLLAQFVRSLRGSATSEVPIWQPPSAPNFFFFFFALHLSFPGLFSGGASGSVRSFVYVRRYSCGRVGDPALCCSAWYRTYTCCNPPQSVCLPGLFWICIEPSELWLVHFMLVVRKVCFPESNP